MITVDRLRAVALTLPEVEERETWGRPTLRVRGKMFLTLSDDAATVTVKARPDEQAALIAVDAETFAVAAYVGRYGWVQVRLDRVEAGQLEELVVEAWRQTAPKRLVAAFDQRP